MPLKRRASDYICTGKSGIHTICWRIWIHRCNSCYTLGSGAGTKFYWYILSTFLTTCRLLTSILVVAVVQIFYAYGIRILSESYLILILVVLVSFVLIHHLKFLVLICIVGITPAAWARCTKVRGCPFSPRLLNNRTYARLRGSFNRSFSKLCDLLIS